MQCKCCRWLIGSAFFFCWGDGPPLQTDEQWTKVPASRMTAFRMPAMLAVCHNYTKQPIRYSSRLYENNEHELTNTTLTQKHSHVESGWNKYENDKIYHTFDGVCVFHFAYQWHFNWKYQRNKSQIEMERTGLEEGGGCMSSDYCRGIVAAALHLAGNNGMEWNNDLMKRKKRDIFDVAGWASEICHWKVKAHTRTVPEIGIFCFHWNQDNKKKPKKE